MDDKAKKTLDKENSERRTQEPSQAERSTATPPPRTASPAQQANSQEESAPKQSGKAAFFDALAWQDDGAPKEDGQVKLPTQENERLVDDDEDESDDDFESFQAQRLGNAGQNGAPAQGEAPASSSANFFQADFQEESQTSAGQEDLFANFSTGMSAAEESQTADLLNIGGGSDRVAPSPAPNVDLLGAGPRDPTNLDLLVDPTANLDIGSTPSGSQSQDTFDPFMQAKPQPKQQLKQQATPKHQQPPANDTFDPFAAPSSNQETPASKPQQKSQPTTKESGDVLFDPFASFGQTSNSTGTTPSSATAPTGKTLFDPFGGTQRATPSPTHGMTDNLNVGQGGMTRQAHSSENLLGDFGGFTQNGGPTLKQVCVFVLSTFSFHIELMDDEELLCA